VLSRVADSVFWMSRYTERAENVARFIDVNYNLTLDLGEAIDEQWMPLVNTSGDHELFRERYPETTRENVLQFLTFDSENPNSILSCVTAARANARQVREVISAPMWEELNKFYLFVREASTRLQFDDLYEFLHRVKIGNHLLVGATDDTMTHNDAWHFTRLGRYLERADKTSRIVDVKYFILLPDAEHVGTPLDVVQWSALLKSASALMMYRQAHGQIEASKIVDFLVLNRQFPRSMHFCVIHAEDSLHAITGSQRGTFCNRAEQFLGRLRAEMDYTTIEDVIRNGLHEYIDSFQRKLNIVGDAVHEEFFDIDPHEIAVKQGLAIQ